MRNNKRGVDKLQQLLFNTSCKWSNDVNMIISEPAVKLLSAMLLLLCSESQTISYGDFMYIANIAAVKIVIKCVRCYRY